MNLVPPAPSVISPPDMIPPLRSERDTPEVEPPMVPTAPTSCRAYHADTRSAGGDIYGNQDLHVPVLQRARDMQVFLYILLLASYEVGEQRNALTW